MNNFKCVYKTWSVSLLTFVLVGGLTGQADTTSMYIFGHSLIVHDPPAMPTPSDETTVPHWFYLLGQSSGKNYEVAGQYGFLPQHADLPPISQWGFDSVPPAWDSDNMPFPDADFSHILLTAANFIQYQPAHYPYDGGNGVESPLSATLEIFDWVQLQQDSLSLYVYENWPDMAPFLSNGSFPPTESELASYHAFTLGTFNDWWIEYHDSLLVARPSDSIRMIPVGPVIAGLLTETTLSQIAVTDLYEDDAPHGKPTIYFLAGLITYMGVYQEIAPFDYPVPDIVDSIVVQNFPEVVNYAWNKLLDFNDSLGHSRVFYSDDVVAQTDLHLQNDAIVIYPNPAQDYFQIKGVLEPFDIDILDINGNVFENLNASMDVLIDISALPPGLYFVRVRNQTNTMLEVQKILKQ